MKAITIDKCRMFISTDGVADENSGVLYAVPGLQDKHTQFKGILTEINVKLDAAGIKIILVGPDKKRLKGEITDDVCEYMSFAEGWATINNDDNLINRIHFTPSALRETADTLFVSRCRIIIGIIEEMADKLTGFGLTPEMLTAVKEKIKTFEKLIPKSRENIGNKKVATINLDAETDAADAILIKMDKLVETIRRKNPDVYTKYKTARVIVNSATRKAGKKGEEEIAVGSKE